MNKVKKHYSKKGTYLKDHEKYLSEENLKRDTEFIIKSLNITKKDKCLDLQCAQGRITLELNHRGYNADGLDFSKNMIDIAKKEAKEKGLKINYFIQDLNKMKLKEKYTKVFLFFSDWRNLNFEKILPKIKTSMEKGGLLLYDHDNLFRIWSYLENKSNIKNRFTFDPKAMTLNGKDNNKDRYYTYTELEDIFLKNGFKVLRTYGGWYIKEKEYKYNSPRLRIIAKKI